MEPGQFVEFVENDRHVLAMCSHIKGERIAAITQTGREVTLNTARLVHVSSERFSSNLSRAEIEKLLQDRNALRNKLKEEVGLTDIEITALSAFYSSDANAWSFLRLSCQVTSEMPSFCRMRVSSAPCL